MDYIAQYNSINFSKIPSEIAVEFRGIYDNTQGFTRYVNLEAQNFTDLYDLIESMPGAIKKKKSGKAKKVIEKATQLRTKKATRTQGSKKLVQKRKDLVTSKTASKPKFKVGDILMHKDYKKVTITSFIWVESRNTYSYSYKTSTGIGNDDEASFSIIVNKPAETASGQQYKIGGYVIVRFGKGGTDYHAKIATYYPALNGYEVLIAEDGGRKFKSVIPASFLSKSNKEAYSKALNKKQPEETPERAAPAVKEKPAIKTQATSERASVSGKNKTAVTPKSASSAKENKKDLALMQKVQDLRTVVFNKREQVRENAKFKGKLAIELRTYLKQYGIQINGLSGLADEYEKLKMQDKFYSNLLSGDKADFTAIAKKLGIVYRKGSIKVSERTRKAVGMSGRNQSKATKLKAKK